MIYDYKAFTRQGKAAKGTIEAINAKEARDKLRDMQLIVSSLEPQKKGKKRLQLSRDDLRIFTSQLAQLLAAQIPLYESLLALEEQARQEPYHPVILGLTDRIKRGSSLSQAMQDFSESFSPLYRALISAGEAVGNLELALSRLNNFLVHDNKIRKQLISALIYPALLSGLLVVAITVLVGFVIPSLEQLFEDKNTPQFTKLVFGAAKFLREWGILVVGAFIGLLVYGFYRIRQPKTKASIQRNILHIPLINRYVILAALSRFARTLGTLLEGGLPLTVSLAYAKEALGNARLNEIMLRVEQRIIEGIPFSTELSRYKEMPPLFSRMVLIGEESGKLSSMLNQLATLYEEETERTLTRVVALAQPVMLLLMGGLIGGVLLAILMPLSSFGSSIQI
ncbi:MAG: type II secretion system F family protein [Verrucomicrobia bacterium]|nr:type II secretion system F family protein [Verrucomicrobiota bacterium]